MHSSRMHTIGYSGCVWGVSVLWVYVWGSVLLGGVCLGVYNPRPRDIFPRPRSRSSQSQRQTALQTKRQTFPQTQR